MRNGRRRRGAEGRVWPATADALGPLTGAGRVFERASPETLARVLAEGAVRAFGKGEVVFEQGVAADDLPLFGVLSGRFAVIHVWGDRPRHVGSDGAGGLIGDVELLLRGEPTDGDESALRGIAPGRTWARVQCASPGEALCLSPADFLLADHAVALALARGLARKMLLRAAVADPKTLLSKPQQVELYLRRVARDLAGRADAARDRIEIPMSLADVAEAVGCAKQTVAAALVEMSARHPGFSHARSLIVVPRPFLQEPSALFERGK